MSLCVCVDSGIECFCTVGQLPFSYRPHHYRSLTSTAATCNSGSLSKKTVNQSIEVTKQKKGLLVWLMSGNSNHALFIQKSQSFVVSVLSAELVLFFADQSDRVEFMLDLRSCHAF